MAWLWGAAAIAVGAAAVVHALRMPSSAAGVSMCLLLTDQVERAEGLVADALALADRLSPLIRDLVLVDTGSTDGTADILGRISRDRPALKVVLLRDRESAAGALELAEMVCAGPWILSKRVPPRSVAVRG